MASSPGCIRSGLACLPAAGYPRELRGLSGGGFAQLLSCFGEATCTQRCRFLFSCHQNFAVKRRLCLGHLPSLPTCVSESMHSLMVMFLAGMPAYAITVASTHSCPSSPAMFVWSPCGTQPGGSCTLLLSTCVYKPHTHTLGRVFLTWVHGSETLALLCSCCKWCEIQPLSQLWK